MTPAEADAALAQARAAGIHQMAVPTPFLVGRVNCYLIEDDPLRRLQRHLSPSGGRDKVRRWACIGHNPFNAAPNS